MNRQRGLARTSVGDAIGEPNASGFLSLYLASFFFAWQADDRTSLKRDSLDWPSRKNAHGVIRKIFTAQ